MISYKSWICLCQPVNSYEFVQTIYEQPIHSITNSFHQVLYEQLPIQSCTRSWVNSYILIPSPYQFHISSPCDSMWYRTYLAPFYWSTVQSIPCMELTFKIGSSFVWEQTSLKLFQHLTKQRGEWHSSKPVQWIQAVLVVLGKTDWQQCPITTNISNTTSNVLSSWLTCASNDRQLSWIEPFSHAIVCSLSQWAGDNTSSWWYRKVPAISQAFCSSTDWDWHTYCVASEYVCSILNTDILSFSALQCVHIMILMKILK